MKDAFGISSFYDITFDGIQAWYVDQYHNILEHTNLTTKETCVESVLPIFEDTKDLLNQYGNINMIGNTVCIAPRNSSRILFYDKKNKSFESALVEEEYLTEFGNMNIINTSFTYKDHVYLIPGLYKRIIKINIRTREIRYVDFEYDKVNLHITEPNRVIFARNTIVENVAYISFWQGGFVLKINLSDDSTEFVKVCDCTGLSGIAYHNKQFSLALRDNPCVLKLDEDLRLEEKISIEEKAFGNLSGISHLIDSSDFVYLIPGFGDGIIRMSRNANNIKKIYDLPMEESECIKTLWNPKCSVMCTKKISDEMALAYSVMDAKIVILNLKNDEIRSFDAYVNDKNDRTRIKKYCHKFFYGKKDFCNEINEFGLEDFIRLL